ncbi:S-layer homology domain-containing protein [Colidextribacter sp. 210702-DFI.3.9]|nr:S-layer homology domain-containing protein [Colidextribacter sp. 210702-DFI.3.9]MCG4469084.1 S-layer homology domain-containing protein [Lawsonibacter sp. DFI.6.74]MCG4774295.1 S-layer homology domain-containing protein [Lawsonibacter sp. DFI.5.51]
MRKKLSALLAAALAVSMLTLPAGAVSRSTALETVRALGILAGDSQGNLNLSSAVTRAEFVTMMTAASSYKDTVGSGYGVSLFKDVKSSHWASEYIRLAVEQNWMTGYTDGTFRPGRTITLEEACTALLRLLGYDASSLAGSFPTAQLSKAGAVGLLDDVTAKQGQTLTRQDCVTLFYHLLLAETKAGAVYGTTLGYTVKNNEVDYAAVVSADTKGPYVADNGGGLTLPFTPTAVYVDGALSGQSQVKQYDVYYYNAALRTVWVYTDRATGTLTDLSPSKTAPTSATVAGVTYSIGSSTASYKLSSQGQFSQGDVVTVLLGMDGDIVDVVSAQNSETTYYGVVIASTKAASSSSTSASSNATAQAQTQVACSDGTVRTFYHSGGAQSVGKLVSVAVTQSGTTLSAISRRSLSGTVNSAGTRFAGYSFADNVDILDTDSDGGYARIYPSRLAGYSLTDDDVLFYSLDSTGSIDCLILDEATGDTYTYAFVTQATSKTDGSSLSGSYTYLQNGQSHSVSGQQTYSVKVGGARLTFSDNGSLKGMRQLSSVNLTGLTSLTATAGSSKYALAEDVTVLLRDGSQQGYYPTTLSAVNSTDYSLVGWYDNQGASAGGRIRILVATKK